MDKQVVVNYVIRARKPSVKEWISLGIEDTREAAEKQYVTWNGTPAVQEGRLIIELVERAAYITDKVIISSKE